MKFVSKKREFRLIIRPTNVFLDESRRPQVDKGEKVEFKNGMFFTEDKSLISYLLHHKQYGLSYTSEIGNDPVAIEKASMVFDDGAEITGPKIVAGFPEKNSPRVIEMVTGGMSTQSMPKVQTKAEEFIPQVPPKESITKEEVVDLISQALDAKLDLILDRIGAVALQPSIKGTRVKKFHCSICGEELPSGFAVKKHKDDKHSN